MNICIFEDAQVINLTPVNDLRHTSELICGAFSLLEKINNIFPAKSHRFTLHVRKQLEQYFSEKFPDCKINSLYHGNTLFLNSRVIFSRNFIEGILLNLKDFENTVFLNNKTIAVFYCTADKTGAVKKIIESRSGNNLVGLSEIKKLGLKEIQITELDSDAAEDLRFINYPSDLILFHEDEIVNDLQFLFRMKKRSIPARHRAYLINKKWIHIPPNCNIHTNTVLDASKGSIFISPGVTIEPFSYITGPVFIGVNSIVRAGSKLYGPLTIGSSCKVSGEIVSSIIHSYTNKQHLGFLGHSYLCEWVNLGAGTTTSNLKNNYSKISLRIGVKNINTDSIFLGSIIGDHTKTGINTMLNTGTVIGISSNLFGAGFHSKLIPSFSWTDAQAGTKQKYDISKAISTAKISMKRRNVAMTGAYENLLIHYYKKSRV
jgi:UDP-N-acetylglucosamine diphosphorylase/glucosamine-1-phosphate N-acetyltransferase